MANGRKGQPSKPQSLSAHHGFDNLTILVDHNGLQGFGSTDAVASMNPLHERLSGFGFEIRKCDGHDLDSIRAALAPGRNRPVIVILNTIKGRGVPDVAGHRGKPLPAFDCRAICRRDGAVQRPLL